jgi:flagellar biosynthesis GTPase FlhF
MDNELAVAERGIGDNSAPSDIEILRERLVDNNAALLTRRDELLAALPRIPETIGDDETCGKVADMVKLFTACAKTAEGARIAAKEPFLQSERAVDGFFKQISEPLLKAKVAIEARLTAYQRVKAAEERRRREAEEQRQREEAARLAREAQERAEQMRSQQDLEEAVTAGELAQQAAADAERAAKAAVVKPAELSRSRGEFGAVASLRTFMDFRNLDRETIDLAPLRPHLALDAIDKAVRSFIRAGGRKLRGVEIFENTTSQVR